MRRDALQRLNATGVTTTVISAAEEKYEDVKIDTGKFAGLQPSSSGEESGKLSKDDNFEDKAPDDKAFAGVGSEVICLLPNAFEIYVNSNGSTNNSYVICARINRDGFDFPITIQHSSKQNLPR